MIPLTIKQQKFSKMSAVMQPEIQKIQKKYAEQKRSGFHDEAAGRDAILFMRSMELHLTGGCLPMLIQMPILFALYPVIQ